MNPTSNSAQDGNGFAKPDDAQAQERLREVAAKIRAMFAILAEIEANYPETWAKERGALPLEAFLHEFEQIA